MKSCKECKYLKIDKNLQTVKCIKKDIVFLSENKTKKEKLLYETFAEVIIRNKIKFSVSTHETLLPMVCAE